MYDPLVRPGTLMRASVRPCTLYVIVIIRKFSVSHSVTLRHSVTLVEETVLKIRNIFESMREIFTAYVRDIVQYGSYYNNQCTGVLTLLVL